MAGVLSASVASKVLPLEGLIDEDGATDGPFVFQPPEGADLLDELHLDKETFFLLIGALTQSNTLDANMALGVLCKEHLDKPALETLCVRLFAALKQLESEKEKKSRRSGLSSRNSLTVDKRLSNTSSAREDGEKVNVWDRLSRPVGATPRDSDEYAAKLAELSSTMPPPQVVEEEEPRKVLVKSESEAKVIFNRLYCDAARWKVRKRVYTELALMAEDAKVAKECPFQPTIRKTKKDDASDTTQPSASQRLYEESKSRSSRRQDLCINAPTPSFQPETSRSARDRLSASGEEFHLRLHKDATKYREMRQNLNDYQLAVCTFRPDTAQSHRSGPKVNTIPIWRRSISKPEAKIESKQPKHV